jgi:hypothetical protein
MEWCDPRHLLLALLTFAAVFGAGGTAAAHGNPAAVLGVARGSADGRPQVLRLTEGLALSAEGAFGYVCPALFNSDESPRAVGLASGDVVVATRSDVFLLASDGIVTPYPDPGARTGLITALEGNGEAAFLLRTVANGSELVQLDGEHAQVIATLPAEYSSLAVEGDALLVAGMGAGGRVLQRGLRSDGKNREQWSAEAAGPLDTVAVFARIAGQRPYLVVVAGSELGSELVRVDDDGRYTPLQRAGSTISGPIVAGERVLFAFDGRLAELRDDEVSVHDSDTITTCVGRSGPLAYACANAELLRLEGDALGARVFGLDEIAAPALDGLDHALAERCALQWLRFRADLVLAGVTPRSEVGELPPSTSGEDGGMRSERDAGSARRDAGSSKGARPDAGNSDGDCAVQLVRGSVTREHGRGAFRLIGSQLAIALALFRFTRRGRARRDRARR